MIESKAKNSRVETENRIEATEIQNFATNLRCSISERHIQIRHARKINRTLPNRGLNKTEY